MIRTITVLGLALCLMGLKGAPARFQITQENKKFSREELVVSVGDSVTFINDDNVTHNVFSNSMGLEFNLRTQPPGKAGTVVFADPGTARVRCAFHPSMRLTVRVR